MSPLNNTDSVSTISAFSVDHDVNTSHPDAVQSAAGSGVDEDESRAFGQQTGNGSEDEERVETPQSSPMFAANATTPNGNLDGESGRSTRPLLGKSSTTKSWALELLALFASISSFAAILVILITYHEKPQPNFAYTVININTLVAIASTISRATMVFIGSEVIGQSKWLWMEKPRPLRDMERFDNAARGAWGSLKLFFYSWKPTMTLIGAFIVITSYAIGPFAQQATTSYSCNITGEGIARISIAKYVSNDKEEGGRFDEVSRLTPEMQAMAINGLIYGEAGISLLSSNLFECGSGNCTFDSHLGITHSSVGMCSRCVDVADELQQFDKGPKNGTKIGFADWVNDPFSLYWPIRQKGLTMFSENGTTTVLAFTAADCTRDPEINSSTERDCNQPYGRLEQPPRISPSREIGIIATNCTLYPCLRHYNASVTNNVLDERLVSQEPMISTMMRVYSEKLNSWTETELLNGYYIKLAEPCFLNGQWYDSSNISTADRKDVWTSWRSEDGILEYPTECLTVVTPKMIDSIRGFLTYQASGDCEPDGTKLVGGERPSSPLDELLVMECGLKWWVGSLFQGGNATFGTISTAFDGMATAMTDYLRTKGLRYSGNYSDLPSQTFVTGSERLTAICIRANWAWLAYPGGLLIITTSLLVVAYVQSYQYRNRWPVWKSATLPLLFYDIKDGRDRDAALPLLQISELRSLADNTVVTFRGDADGPGFVIEQNEQTAARK